MERQQQNTEFLFGDYSLDCYLFDAGSDFGSQSDVPGRPGKILEKPGSGFSVGPGAVVNTPVGPIRIEAASQDFSGNWRYNIGIGWKF